jgi:hypothetical protein
VFGGLLERHERRGLHTQRLQYRALNVFRKRHLLRPLQNIPHHADAGVGILRALTRPVHQLRFVQALHRGSQRGPSIVEVVAHGRLADQTGAMGHQLPQRDRFAERISRTEVVEVFFQRCIQVQLTALHQLHDTDGGQQLRNGTDTIDGRRIGGEATTLVGNTEPVRPDDAIAVDQGDG